MTDTQTVFLIVMAGWTTISVVNSSSRLARIATALERLVALAERGRR